MVKQRKAASDILEKEGPFEVKVHQTVIRVYPLARGEYQFRYRIGDEEKRVTRSTRAKIIVAATEKATEIHNGRAQAGAMTAAEIQSYTHARRQLKLDDPPVHVIVEEWVRLKGIVGNASLDELAAAWKRTRPRGRGAASPGDSLVQAVAIQLLTSMEHKARASGTERNVTGFRHDLARFCERFGKRTMADVSADEIENWLRTLGVGTRRQDNLRGELVTFFRFARDRGHLPDEIRVEPEKVPKLTKPGQEIEYYRPSELRRLLAACSERWLPWLAIQAFAGLRSSEVGRLEWSDFDWTERRIYVPASKALKVRRRRPVPIEQNLFAWLLPWHNATGRLYDLGDPSNHWARYTAKLAERAKVPWRNNNLRHARATYWMAVHENFGLVAYWMGNSEAKMKENYDGVGRPKDAKEWNSIMPKRAAGDNIVAIPAAKLL